MLGHNRNYIKKYISIRTSINNKTVATLTDKTPLCNKFAGKILPVCGWFKISRLRKSNTIIAFNFTFIVPV